MDTDYIPIWNKQKTEHIAIWEFFVKHEDGVYIYQSFNRGKTWSRQLTPYNKTPVVQLKFKDDRGGTVPAG